MAQNQANFGLNFRVDKSGLNDLKKSLQDIMRLGQQKSSTGELKEDLKQACQAAKQLETILDGAWNSKLGQLNLDKVNQGIKNTYHSVEELQTALGKTPQGQVAFNKMASQVLNTNLQLKQTNKLLDDMATSMANTVKWGIASSVFNGITRSVQDAFYYVKSLNSSLTDIRIVTGASADQMASFAEKANAAAKALGQTTRNYTDASLIYYQQGLSEADVEARTQTTLKAANVTGQSAEEVSELLTSVWNGYKVSAAEAELYIDKIAAVATTTASDLEELSVGMSKVASAASLMGVDIDQLNAQLATIVSVTRQAPESVGTALKTIYARMGDIEAGLDGETTLGNYTEQMKEMGFNVLDAQGKLRDMGSVIEEIGGKWSSMTREQQLSLAQTVAGTRQYNNLLALFDNWDMYTSALNTSSQAMGTLQEQQDMYLESTGAKLKQLQTELESTYSSMLNTDTLNAAIDGVTALAETFNDFIEGLGGGEQALTYFGSMAVNVFSKQIGSSIFQTIQNIKSVKTNLEAFKAKEKWADAVLKDVKEQHLAKGEGKLDDSALAKEAQYAQKTLQIRQALTQEQYDQFTSMQAEIGLKERELNYLREYQNLSSEIMDYDDASTQALEERLALEEKLLSKRESRRDSTSKELSFLGSVESDEEDQDILLQRLGTLGNIVATEQEYVALETIADKIRANTALTEKENALVLDLEKRLVTEQKEVVQKLKQAIEGKKAAENGTLDILEEEQAARERILRQQQKQAEKQLKIQKTVQAVGTALEIGTALVNAMAVGFDEASSGAEKANAAFSGITGVAAGIMDYFMPGTGILVQGAFSLVKAGLEATGVWEKFENIFKTTAEKVAEVDEAVSTIGQSEAKTSSQIASLKAIEEEYALLSEKAGRYGQNLDSMTEAEQARYAELTSAFTQYNDSVIIGYDDQGRAIVDNQTALQETIDLLQRMHEEEARTTLGNVSEKIAAKDEEISKQKYNTGQYTEVNTRKNFAMEQVGYIKELASSVSQNIGVQLKNEVATAQVEVKGAKYDVETLIAEINSLGEQTIDGFTEYSVQDLDFALEGIQQLSNLYKDVNNYVEDIDLGKSISNLNPFTEDVDPTIFPQEVMDNFLQPENNIVNKIEKLTEDYKKAIENAKQSFNDQNQILKELKDFDVNFILDVLRFGEGYDSQWDALSDQGKDVGYNILVQYLEGIEYGYGEGKAYSYDKMVTMGQDFLVGLNVAIEKGFSNIQFAADAFNTEQLNSEVKLTFAEKEEQIRGIIEEEIANIEGYAELGEDVKAALELMFEDAFNIELTLDDKGSITGYEDPAQKRLEDIRKTINNVAKENLLSGEEISSEFLEANFSDDLQKLDEIIQYIDWSRIRTESLALEDALLAAKEAAEAGKTVISELREEAAMGEDILNKLQNKEELTNDEMAYLNSLAETETALQNLVIGTEEYNNALLEVLATKKKNNEIKLRKEIRETNAKITRENNDNTQLRADMQTHLDNGGKETDQEYINMQAAIDVNDSEIASLEAYLANLEYEILCLVTVEADPDIASQIRNLYNDADTLISVRATVENDQALSEDQTQALGGFFASDAGQSYAEEYLQTGVLTEEMLLAVEAFAQGRRELGDVAREDLEKEIKGYLEAANTAKQEAENLRNDGDTEGAEKKETEAATNYAAAGVRTAELAQIDSEEAERDQQTFETEMEGFGLKVDEVEDLTDIIQDTADESEELSDNLIDNADAAREVAKEIKRAEKAVESIKDNYKDWSKALEESNEFSEEYGEALEGMRTSFEDFLDLDYDSLSDEFVKSAEAQELLQKAMSGTEEEAQAAYNELQALAAQDIYNEDIGNLSEDISNEMQEIAAIESIDIGEKIVIGENEIANRLSALYTNAVNAAVAGGQSVASAMQTANNIINAVGFDAPDIEMEEKTVYVTGELPDGATPIPGGSVIGPDGQTIQGYTWQEEPGGSYTYAVTMLLPKKGSSFTKSSENFGGANTGGGGNGGGGGGGGGGGKKLKKPEKRQKDYYHKINKNIKKLTTSYERLAEIQDKTFGKEHIKNIKKVNENIDQQIVKLRKRIKIAKEQERVDLKEEIQKNYKGVKFDVNPENGLEFIANYDTILQKYYDKYYNAKTQEAQDKAKKKYDDLKDLLDRFEKVNETIDSDVAEIRSLIDEKYQNFIAQFEYEIEMRINWGETDRDVREFFKNFNGNVEGINTGLSEIDFEGLANFEKMQFNSFMNSGELTSKTRQIGDIIKEIEKIDAANAAGYKITNKDEEKYFSDIYGDDKNKAMEDLKARREELMGDLEKMKDARNNAYDAYLDAIDDGIEKFDKHIEQYEMINEEISHNMNLIEMLYGETSDMMEAQYDLQESSYLGQLTSLKKISDTYKSQWENEKKLMAEMEKNGDTTSQAYAEAKERAEIYEEAYNESVSNLQKTTEEAVQNLIDEYAFGVKKTLDNMADSLFSSKDNPTFNTALTEWELMEKESSMYLDNINAAFEIQKLESKYRDALNSTDSITAQKKLNEVMEYELGVLREKDKLSQYEIDRANLQYELTLKQIALEEAQQNKSKMRLRRDAQGNYSYQFTADTDNINKAKEEVNDVLQQLTNLSQEKGKEIYNTALNETQNFIERMAEIETMADGAEKDRLRALTQENYNRVMGDLMSQSELVENHIHQLVDGPLAEIMSKEEQLFVGDKGISTQVINLTKTLRDNIAGKGGMANITGIALQEIKDKSDAYKTSLEQIEGATGKAFKQLSSEKYVNGIKTKIGDLTTATDGLASSWTTTLDNIKLVITEMDKALTEAKKVKKALEAVKAAEAKEKKEYKAAGDAAKKENKNLVKDDEKPTDTKKNEEKTETTTTTTTTTTKKKKGTGNGKVEVGDKVTIKSSYAAYAGGSYISNPKYKKGSKLYIQKISGSWVHVGTKKAMNASTQVGWIKKKDISGYDTGGYTGDWGNNGGKLAFLHKKELVLNQKDTQNILDAVNIIRGLSGLLQNSMINRIEGLTQSLNGLSLPTVQTNSETGPQAIEQTVHITAEFPGATEALQIETALNNLVNRASQYAFRKE